VHELGLAIEILRAARTELAAAGGGRLASVRIAVGDLSAVEPDLLQYAWSALTAEEDGGRHRGAELVVDWVRAVQTCAACGEVPERQPGTWLRLCPHCALPLRVEGGDALELLELTFDPIVHQVEVPT